MPCLAEQAVQIGSLAKLPTIHKYGSFANEKKSVLSVCSPTTILPDGIIGKQISERYINSLLHYQMSWTTVSKTFTSLKKTKEQNVVHLLVVNFKHDDFVNLF